MKWRSWKIWLPVFIVCGCFGWWNFWYIIMPPPVMTIGGEERLKALEERKAPHFSTGKEVPAPPPKPDYTGIGLKIGSGFGGLMSLISFIEKLVKWVRRK